MNAKQFLRTVTVAIIAMQIAMPQPAVAQKLKDFQEAMKKTREFATGYKMTFEKPRSRAKVDKVAKENGFIITDKDLWDYYFFFVPESEWKDYQLETEFSQIREKNLVLDASNQLELRIYMILLTIRIGNKITIGADSSNAVT